MNITLNCTRQPERVELTVSAVKVLQEVADSLLHDKSQFCFNIKYNPDTKEVIGEEDVSYHGSPLYDKVVLQTNPRKAEAWWHIQEAIRLLP